MFDALTLDHVRNKGEPKNKGPKAEIGVGSWGGAAADYYIQHSGCSSDTVILLIVDYHAVVGGQDLRAPLCTPLMVRNCVNAAEDIVISNYYLG